MWPDPSFTQGVNAFSINAPYEKGTYTESDNVFA